MEKITVIEFETESGRRFFTHGDDLSHCITQVKMIVPAERLTIHTMEVIPE